MDEHLLEIRGLTKAFGETQALRGVDLDLHGGEVVALLGQNGAGKSTLIKILAGLQRPSAGSVRIGGHRFEHGLRPEQAHEAGLAFVHQDLGLVEGLSVAENVAHVAGFPTRRGLVSWRRCRDFAHELLRRWEFDVDPGRRVADLDPVQRSLVAISRALARDARLVVLDEPTAALPGHEVETLFAAVERLRAGGVGVLYVTHRLHEVDRLADRIVVLRDGERVADVAAGAMGETEIVDLIIGEQQRRQRLELAPPGTETMLVLDDVRSHESEPGVSLQLRGGEILGLVGLVGAGHRTVGRLVGGAATLASGSMTLGGSAFQPASPRDALARGVAFLPGDRLTESSFQEFDAASNFWARPVGARFLRPRRERRLAGEAFVSWDVHPAEPSLPFRAFSGGNQQRVLLSKWLDAEPSVLVVNEPTAGVDVGGRAALYGRLLDAAARGVATLLVSTDAEEVAEIAHRAIVFGDGRPSCELSHAELSIDRIALECARA
jgi:ribose transport system ATP-binding protein